MVITYSQRKYNLASYTGKEATKYIAFVHSLSLPILLMGKFAYLSFQWLVELTWSAWLSFYFLTTLAYLDIDEHKRFAHGSDDRRENKRIHHVFASKDQTGADTRRMLEAQWPRVLVLTQWMVGWDVRKFFHNGW